MLAGVHSKVLFLVSLLITLLSFAGFITLMVVWQMKLTPFQDFAVVVDAGSTHSSIFVYTWPADKSDGLGLTSRVNQHAYCDVRKPITDIKDPTSASAQAYFQEQMDICVNKIPQTRKDRALIFLGATAGLRLSEIQKPAYTNALLNSTRDYFSTLGLLFKSPENQVRIISGSEEGLAGWISTNILMDELYKKHEPAETYGVSDIGGASTQISFYYPNATNELYNLSLFNTDYNLYSHSYLCYGANEFRRRYLTQLINNGSGSETLHDPCLQKDSSLIVTYNDVFDSACSRDSFGPSPALNSSLNYTLIGTGNYDQCLLAIQNRFNRDNCTFASCSFDQVYQPKPIPSTLKFFAISAWYRTFTGIAPNVSLTPNAQGNYDFNTVNFADINRAIAAICSQSWLAINSTDPYRSLLCFNSMFHWTLLQYGYGMRDENLENFHIIKNINGNDIGWTLGYMINQTNYLDPQYRPPKLLTKTEFGVLVTLCVVCFILSILAAIYFKRLYNNRREKFI